MSYAFFLGFGFPRACPNFTLSRRKTQVFPNIEYPCSSITSGSLGKNLTDIDTGKFVVKTEYATIAVDPAHSYQVESRIINGKPYILIPVGEGVEINGMAVKVQD